MGDAEDGIEAGERATALEPYHPDWYAASLGCARFIARELRGQHPNPGTGTRGALRFTGLYGGGFGFLRSA